MSEQAVRGVHAISRTTRLTASIVACALFMQTLDSTVISTALPAMARAFHADAVGMSVALTSYLISLAAFIPASGWMADRYGTRQVFRAAIAVFTLGSVLCGRADTLGFLVAARVLQGMGGAMMVPVGRLVLLRSVAKTELVAAMAWLTIPALLGPVIGPPLGGLIVTYASWRWIFDINVPIGLLGIALVTWFVHDVREPRPVGLDWRGLVLSGLALAGLMLAVEIGARGLVSLGAALTIGAGALTCAALYGWHARRHPAPLLDLSLMRVPTFAVSVYAGSLFRIGIGAMPFLLPLMLQIGFGDSAARSGMVTFAGSAGALVMKPVATRVIGRLGFRRTLLWNGLIGALTLGACGAFRPAWPLAAIYAVLLIGGFFRSLQFTAFNTIAYADLSRAQMSAATSLYSTLQQVSLTFGVVAGAIALQAAMTLRGHAVPSTGDFGAAFYVVAGFCLLSVPIALALRRDAGASLIG
ncbi:MFS transporter [Acidisphaera rubrifaciens]|uniref:Major facilitator superfamily multidrug resistance transporter n=1 Tax=Acidisphaera rubrifaciens HS-AP3 TaxID=1231350 RepID=A0A0D6P8G4_9PROT|nr:MFS transporter [Acidisphaera rubrifaciens]GAN77962.1 major facilitator superfamily multidrug resistance transporter [Acidisphaera rubrifaciens HS-AP3]